MKKPPTPFPTTGYYGKEYFCDREDEKRTLLDNIRGGQSSILVAPRRIGKTALVRHVLASLPRGVAGVYLDILATEDTAGFLNALATAIMNAFPESTRTGKNIMKMIKSLRPVLSYNPLSGVPQVSLDLRPGEVETNVAMLLEYLEKQSFRTVIAIDEFQQILKYPEANTDAMLRGIIQQLNNVIFIFSGSHQHLMSELFSNPSRPFYNSARLLKIGRIDRERYLAFIHKKFTGAKKVIDPTVINNILGWTDCYTYYVQMLCNRIFVSQGANISETSWKEEADRLIDENEFVFFNYRNLLTQHQWDLLRAIAREGMVYHPTSKDFISDNSLGSPATVLRSLNALLKMEIIYTDYTPDGQLFYFMNDVLFRRWCQR